MLHTTGKRSKFIAERQLIRRTLTPSQGGASSLITGTFVTTMSRHAYVYANPRIFSLFILGQDCAVTATFFDQVRHILARE